MAGLAFLYVMARTMAMARAARTNEKAKERRATRRARTKANPTREGLLGSNTCSICGQTGHLGNECPSCNNNVSQVDENQTAANIRRVKLYEVATPPIQPR